MEREISAVGLVLCILLGGVCLFYWVFESDAIVLAAVLVFALGAIGFGARLQKLTG